MYRKFLCFLLASFLLFGGEASAAGLKSAVKKGYISAERRLSVVEASAVPAVAYTEEERTMMEYVIQQEVRGASIEHKRIIAYVILNRVKSNAFPDTIAEVLTQENQFCSIQNYYQKNYLPDADTKQAVAEALSGSTPDLSQNAMFFYAPKWAVGSSASWFENRLSFCFEMEGHRFFTL